MYHLIYLFVQNTDMFTDLRSAHLLHTHGGGKGNPFRGIKTPNLLTCPLLQAETLLLRGIRRSVLRRFNSFPLFILAASHHNDPCGVLFLYPCTALFCPPPNRELGKKSPGF